MKAKLRNGLTRYLNSWWNPALVCGGLLFLFAAAVYWMFQTPSLAPYIGLGAICVLASFVIALVAHICSLFWLAVKKQWKKLGASLFATLLLGIEIFVISGMILGMVMLFPLAPDNFANNLTIPDDIKISEPVDEGDPFINQTGEEIPRYQDAFRQTMLAALNSSSDADITVTADIENLAFLWKNNPDILARYLATSPAWSLRLGRGGQIAVRRWMVSSDWQNESSRFYKRRDDKNFSIDLEIGFSKKLAKGRKGAVRMRPGETVDVQSFGPTDVERDRYESEVVIHDGKNNFLLVIERSAHRDRDLTRAAIAFINRELAPLAADPTEEMIRTMIPEEGIRADKPSIQLRMRFQPGLYQSASWVNPSEAGTVYLKAFEVTGEVPLSEKRLKFATEERIGWSDDPSELFLMSSKFTIYEGDWDQPYAARFEVWFAPDSDKPERKLTEQNFRIEGWMH